MTERITLYTAKICPFAHRVELALSETDLEYKRYEIDLQAKPEWYAPKVNPASKVPAIAYGGPDVDPAEPSPESTKIAESYVLLEFVADLVASTDKPLLPSTPVARAKARFFAEAVMSKLMPAFHGALAQGSDPANILPAIDTLMELLPKDGGFAVGEWSIADAAVAPFLARAQLSFKNDIGSFAPGQGKKVWETLQTDEKYARFRKYYQDLAQRESFKKTWDEELVKEQFSKRFADIREKKAN